MPSRAAIDAFLDQRHVVLVGLSRNPKDFSRAVFDRLTGDGRTVIGVNPKADGSDGVYASLAEVPDPVDAVLVMVPADQAEGVVAQAVERGVHHVWLHRGAGTGAVSDAAVRRCREAGVSVVDGACPLMFAEPVGFVHKVHRVFAHRRLAA
jgi:predicted CoA-binding protein